MTARRTFLSWFLCALALAAGAAFAVRTGAVQAVWAGDASHMTSVIAALCVATVAWLGRVAWRADGRRGIVLRSNGKVTVVEDVLSTRFAHEAERLSVLLGLLGTTVGLSLQAGTLASSGSASLGALSTSLFTTGTGIASAIVISVIAFIVDRGSRL